MEPTTNNLQSNKAKFCRQPFTKIKKMFFLQFLGKYKSLTILNSHLFSLLPSLFFSEQLWIWIATELGVQQHFATLRQATAFSAILLHAKIRAKN